uniref:Beta-catenin-like protein 1 N-terminal domain-containing protein n=1 Tax=Mycena chlorophos TaxID=658473 RepID=A0ABQ0M7W5_MYCCL|nr:predicted protein [Mycena chlorophos]
MDIDELFKVPKLPAGKRKLPDNPSMEMLKKLKMDTPSQPVPGPSNGNSSRRATVEEVADEDETMEDADVDFAPGGDADYFAEEDDEGRFFGSGLSSEQKEILNIFDNAGEGMQDDPDALSITSIRRMLLRFERAVNKNQDHRSKYPDDPTKFIDSEADLDSAIKGLLPLAQAPVLAYPELVRSGAIALLIGLLSHENADIVIDVVEVIHELTDEDVGNEGAEDEDEERSPEEALKILVEGLVENSILELLVDNLARLNESEESDRVGVFHIMGIFENILGFNPALATALVAKTSLFPWLLKRIEAKTHDENRCYAAELLSILLQNNQSNRLEFGKRDGVEICLKVLSQYRLRDPVNADETEFMENVFDALCSALNEEAIKTMFIASEGPDLLVLMMKEKLQSRSRAIKTLDYAMSGASGTAACEAFIDALGLKTLFSALMGKGSKKQKQNPATPASEDTAHILGVISSLFSNIPSESPSRVRLLAKFVESNYEKVDKLLQIREHATNRLRAAEADIATEKKELLATGEEVGDEEEDAWYLRRLDSGLFTLQTVDYILAWIAMEDDGIRGHLLLMLDRKSLSLKDITKTLRTFYDNVDETDPPASSASGDSERAPTQKEILAALIAALDPDM